MFKLFEPSLLVIEQASFIFMESNQHWAQLLVFEDFKRQQDSQPELSSSRKQVCWQHLILAPLDLLEVLSSKVKHSYPEFSER